MKLFEFGLPLIIAGIILLPLTEISAIYLGIGSASWVISWVER